jgi:hypothetical protein
MALVKKGWWKKKGIQGLEYHVKVIGQLFGSDDDDDDDVTGPRGSCLVTSLEMATWHLKSKQFMKKTGELSVFGDIKAAHRDCYATGNEYKRLGRITTASDSNRGEPFELSSPQYYWSQPVLHSIIMGSPRRMMELVNNSLINLGIYDKCPFAKPTKNDIIDSLHHERTPILTFAYLRPKIKKTAEGTAEVCFPPDNRDRDYRDRGSDWCGHAVVITGWRKTKGGHEFLVNDPSPPPAGVEWINPRSPTPHVPEISSGGLDRFQRSKEVACGEKYWVTENSLFHNRWHPIGLYEVYSNPEMLRENDWGLGQTSYRPEFTGNPKKSLWHRGRVEISNLEIYS